MQSINNIKPCLKRLFDFQHEVIRKDSARCGDPDDRVFRAKLKFLQGLVYGPENRNVTFFTVNDVTGVLSCSFRVNHCEHLKSFATPHQAECGFCPVRIEMTGC